MRIQSVVLENHCDISVLRRDVIYQTVADVKLTLRDLLQTCDHTQGCGLTATRRAYQNDEFLISDFEVYVSNRNETARILLVNASE